MTDWTGLSRFLPESYNSSLKSESSTFLELEIFRKLELPHQPKSELIQSPAQQAPAILPLQATLPPQLSPLPSSTTFALPEQNTVSQSSQKSKIDAPAFGVRVLPEKKDRD